MVVHHGALLKPGRPKTIARLADGVERGPTHVGNESTASFVALARESAPPQQELGAQRSAAARVPGGHPRQYQVRRRRPVITLTRYADASTFIHEIGHQWLEELMRDGEHETAPLILQTDAKTVRNWLGVERGDRIKTRQHEKFARGFEQYRSPRSRTPKRSDWR